MRGRRTGSIDLSHVDAEGRASMVDVTWKKQAHRTATASGRIEMAQETVRLIRRNAIEKGEVLSIAQFAGIQAAKRTSDLIPLCHPLPIGTVRMKTELSERGVNVTSEVSCIGQTGVEMEALTAVSVALLTIYDMCKAVDRSMRIGEIALIAKTKKEAL